MGNNVKGAIGAIVNKTQGYSEVVTTSTMASLPLSSVNTTVIHTAEEPRSSSPIITATNGTHDTKQSVVGDEKKPLPPPPQQQRPAKYADLYEPMMMERHNFHYTYYTSDVYYHGKVHRGLRLDPAVAARAASTHQAIRVEFGIEPSRSTTIKVYHKKKRELVPVHNDEKIYLVGSKIYVFDNTPYAKKNKSNEPSSATVAAVPAQPSTPSAGQQSSGMPKDIMIQISDMLRSVKQEQKLVNGVHCDVCHMSNSIAAPAATITSAATSTAHAAAPSAGSNVIYEDDEWIVVLNTEHAGYWIGRCTLYTKKHFEFTRGKCLSKEYLMCIPRAYRLIAFIDEVLRTLWDSSHCHIVTTTGTPKMRDMLAQSQGGKVSTHGAFDVIPRYANPVLAARRIWLDDQWESALNLAAVHDNPMSKQQIMEIKRLMCKELLKVLKDAGDKVPVITQLNASLPDPIHTSTPKQVATSTIALSKPSLSSPQPKSAPQPTKPTTAMVTPPSASAAAASVPLIPLPPQQQQSQPIHSNVIAVVNQPDFLSSPA